MPFMIVRGFERHDGKDAKKPPRKYARGSVLSDKEAAKMPDTIKRLISAGSIYRTAEEMPTTPMEVAADVVV